MNFLFFEQIHFSFRKLGDQFCKNHPLTNTPSSIEFNKDCANAWRSSEWVYELMFQALLEFWCHNPIIFRCGPQYTSYEINVEDPGVFEIWFGIGQRKVRFSKVKFCLITGLKFGKPSNPITKVYTSIEGGIFMTYWHSLNLNVRDLTRSFTEATFQFKKPSNAVKIVLILFVVTFLFGYDYRTKVNLWIFNLVEDIQQFNSFTWGKYVHQMTYHYLYKGIHSPPSRTELA